MPLTTVDNRKRQAQSPGKDFAKVFAVSGVLAEFLELPVDID
jgi:hypothetical protein